MRLAGTSPARQHPRHRQASILEGLEERVLRNALFDGNEQLLLVACDFVLVLEDAMPTGNVDEGLGSGEFLVVPSLSALDWQMRAQAEDRVLWERCVPFHSHNHDRRTGGDGRRALATETSLPMESVCVAQ